MDRKRSTFVIALAVAVLLLSSAVWAGVKSDAWMGIYTQTVDPDLKEAFELDSDFGVIVKMVVPDSPADKAGLKQGDIILMMDDEKLDDADELVDYIRQHQPGDDIVVKVSRKGVEKEFTVELGTKDNFDDAHDFYFQGPQSGPHSYSKTYKFFDSRYADTYIGVSLEGLSTQLGEYFGVKDGRGALVTEVMPDSPAEKAGLKAGDVIVGIDNEDIEDAADVQKAVRGKDKGEEITIKVIRERSEKQFSFEVEESPESFHPFGNYWVPDDDDDMIFLPGMKGLFHGDFNSDITDMDDLQEEMKQLQHELQEMQKELKKVQKKLE